MKAKDIMSKKVSTVSPNHSVREAAELMKTHDVGALPVMENGKLQGMITDRDIAVRAVAPEKDIRSTKVAEVMTRDPVYCSEEDDIRDVEKKMEQKMVRRLPVLDGSHQVVGIIALADVARKARHEESGEVLEQVSQPHHTPRA